jgi:two-component system, sporulation sensor kinase E
MQDPKTLFITEDSVEANKISKWLNSWDYPVKTLNFKNDGIFTEDLWDYDLILVDLISKDKIDGMNVIETIDKDIKCPVLCFASSMDEKNLVLSENFSCLQKPIDAKELKFAVDMAVYKHKMEKTLQKSEKKYKFLIENADDPIAIVKKDGTFHMVNPNGAQYFGVSPDDIIGKTMWDIFDHQYANSQMKSIYKVIRSGENIVLDNKTLINNEEKWFSTKIQPIKEFNGSINSVQLIARDITAQKMFENDLIERENFFSGILNDMYTYVAVLKPTGEIIFINNTPLKIIGKRLEDVEGMMFYDAPWWDYSDDARSTIKRDIELCAQGKTLSHEIQINTNNGLIWIDHSIHPVFDDHGNVKYLVPEGRDISNIKNTEKALHDEKNRLISLIEYAPVGMVLIDKNGDYKYINPKFREIFGYTHQDIPNGRSWFRKAFKDPEKRHEAILTWKNDFVNTSQGEKRPRTFEVRCKNGETKTISFVPVLIENNEYLMTVEDITARNIAENALKQSEERFRTVASSAVDAIIITDAEGKIVFCNNSVQRIFGYNEDDIIGESVDLLMPHRYKEEFMRKQEQFKLTGRHMLSGKLFESYGYRKDGSEFPIEISITAWEAGGERSTTSIIRDRTERKLVEYELKSTEEKFRQMTENIEEVFWIIDPKMSQILYISPAYQKIWGCSRESLFDNPRSWIESIHPEDRKEVVDTIFRTPIEVRTGKKEGIEYRIKRPDGTIRWIYGRAFPLKDGENKIKRIAGIAVDITRRKRAEDEYRNLFENISVGVYRSTIGPNSRLIEANPAIQEMFNYKESEILAVKASYLYQNTDDKTKFERKIMKFGYVKNEELKFKKKDGKPFTASVSAFVVKDDYGSIKYYDGVIEDITKIKEFNDLLEIDHPSISPNISLLHRIQ